jgi:sec-independent protein translocase protein TatA
VSYNAAMGSLSLTHWIIVVVVLLLVFGPTRLAGVGKGLGEGIRNFKRGLREEDDPEQLPERTEDHATKKS